MKASKKSWAVTMLGYIAKVLWRSIIFVAWVISSIVLVAIREITNALKQEVFKKQ